MSLLSSSLSKGSGQRVALNIYSTFYFDIPELGQYTSGPYNKLNDLLMFYEKLSQSV